MKKYIWVIGLSVLVIGLILVITKHVGAILCIAGIITFLIGLVLRNRNKNNQKSVASQSNYSLKTKPQKSDNEKTDNAISKTDSTKGISKHEFFSKLQYLKIEPREILLFSKNAGGQKADLKLVCKNFVPPHAEYCYQKESGEKCCYLMYIPYFYFVFYTDGDLIDMLCQQLIGKEFVLFSSKEEIQAQSLSELFAEYKEESLELKKRLRQTITSDDLKYNYSLEIKYYRFDFYSKNYPSETERANHIIIYENKTPEFTPDNEQTLCIFICRNNYFVRETLAACFENGKLNFKKSIENLPPDYYEREPVSASVSKDYHRFICEHGDKLPYDFASDFKNSLALAWLSDQFRKIQLWKNEILCVSLIPDKDAFSGKVEIEFLLEKTVKIIQLYDYYFALFTADEFAEMIADEVSAKGIEKDIIQNTKVIDIFNTARAHFLENPQTHKENKDARLILNRLKECCDSFRDVYDEIIDTEGYDDVSGQALYINYIRINKEVPLDKALEQYTFLSFTQEFLRLGNSEKSNYSSQILDCLHPWFWKHTIAIVDEAHLPENNAQKQILSEICKNNIQLLKKETGGYYDVLGDCHLKLKISEGWGMADDAATVGYFEFERL